MTLLDTLEAVPVLLVLVVCGRRAIESPNEPIDVNSLQLSPDSIASLALAHPRLFHTFLTHLREAEPNATVPRCLAIAAPLVWLALRAQEAADVKFATMRASRRPNSIKELLPLVTLQLLTGDELVRYALHPHSSHQGCVFIHALHGSGRSVMLAVWASRSEVHKNVALLRLGQFAVKGAAAAALRGLCLRSVTVRAKIAEIGGIAPLVELTRIGSDWQKENSTAVLRCMASRSPDRQVAIAKAGGIAPLVALARDGLGIVKKDAAGALANLAINDDNKVAIATAGGIPPLVALVNGGTDGQKEWGAGALANLAVNDDNKVAIAKAGGIAPLVALASDGTNWHKMAATGALRNLAWNADNKVAIAQAGGIAPLVALARGGTHEQKEAAAAALSILAHNKDNMAVIAQAGIHLAKAAA